MGIEVLIALMLVATLAGFVDTLAGGGGMMTVPALLISGLPPEAALATNKLQSCFGTLSASWYFYRQGALRHQAVLPGIVCSIVGAAGGAFAVHYLPNTWLAAWIPILLITVALIFLVMPQVGETLQQARLLPWHFALIAIVPIAFYDGFLGPGTGSFFLLALVMLRGRTLRNATIEAKVFNATTNLVSLTVFLSGGHVVWHIGLSMAIGQLIGAHLASRMLIQRGNRLIRPVVITVSLLMSGVLAYRYW